MSRIFIKNLPSSGVTEDEIRKHFADIDNVTDIKLKHNEVGASRRFAFVGFKTTEGAERAIEKLGNSYIKNSKILIEKCKEIKEIKPEKLKLKRDQLPSDDKSDHLSKDKTHGEKKQKVNHKELKKKTQDALDELSHDPEFKEFLDLQQNIGSKNKIKQIWADDCPMDKEFSNMRDESNDDKLNESLDEKQKPEGEKPKKICKRGKRKKKSTKTKPKELFVHTVKISGFPETVRRKEVKDFFKPLECISIRINKRDGICFVSFKDDSDLRFAMRKNQQFYNTSRIKMWKHAVTKSRIFKETAREKLKERDDNFKKYEKSIAETEPIEETGRLFIRNLNYTCTQDDLEQLFTKYGEITEIHYPIDKTTSLPKGFAYVEFMFPQSALKAYQELNGTIFQGRNFHIIPSKPKPEPKFNELPLDPSGRPVQQPRLNSVPANTSTFKREQLTKQKEEAPREAHKSNWNILFLGQNAVADVVSDMKNVDKTKLLTQNTHKDPLAVRMALGDASVVEQMRKFLISNGIELDSFNNPQAPRSRNVIIVKNLPASTTRSDLELLFEKHGKVSQVILPPNGLTGIVEMEEAVDAKLAFKRLAYSKYKDTVLYLEWAPINVFREKSLDDQEQQEHQEMEQAQTGTKILVKNIPFEATVPELRKIFAAYGELNFVRIPKKVDGQHRGFGFVDFLTKEDALRAFQALCHSTHLYGRRMVLEWAKTSDTSSTNRDDNDQNQ